MSRAIGCSVNFPCALLLLVPTASLPCEPSETLHFACTVKNGTKKVEVCHTLDEATYRFGPPGGQAELELRRPVTDVHLTPWPGIGRTIWEEVIFRNASHSYTVYGGIDRAPSEDGSGEILVTLAGGVVVHQAEQEIAHLTCDPGSVDFPWGTGLFEAKETAGQCYDRRRQQWHACAVPTE